MAGIERTPTLYDWAGGRPAIELMIDAFYDRVEADDLLSPLFPGGVTAEHRDHVTTWWSEVFGGPARYTDEVGGYERMLDKHRDLGITADQRFRFASLMSLAADDAGLPSDPEFRSALVAYLEWGTRLALANSQPGAEVVEHAPGAALGLGRCPAVPTLTRPDATVPDGGEPSGTRFSGRYGIRTHGDPEATTAFEAAPFVRSGNLPETTLPKGRHGPESRSGAAGPLCGRLWRSVGRSAGPDERRVGAAGTGLDVGAAP